MRRNKKGFTLIELLAVIVILGLLMAIAIPSVTRYITSSRKKTVILTIESYINAMTGEVNDLTYAFTGNNTVYAVPIECIALDRGGTSPLGKWMQSNNSYWAYVLIQYDDVTSSYRYGYTFKDSKGYGIYPTVQSQLDSKGNQIKTELSLSRPKNGKVTKIAEIDKWSGFEVAETTNLVVLEAESEGNIGDGEKTCTLKQKGDNYNQVEDEKENAIKDHTLVMTTENSTKAFWKYRNQIKTITFEDVINIPSDIDEELKWDLSQSGNGKVMAYMTPNISDSSYYDLYIQTDEYLYANPNSSYLFYNFKYVEIINNIDILDTSDVTDMKGMFYNTGFYAPTFNIVGLSNWNTSKVTDMNHMFDNAGYSSKVFDIGDVGKWNISNVTDMEHIFCDAGMSAKTFNIGNLSNWKTLKVTDMNNMFAGAGKSATKFDIGNLSNWKTLKVTDMNNMFAGAGKSATKFDIGNLKNWDTSKVTNMSYMFAYAGMSAETFNIGDLSNWQTQNVENMSYMFAYAGQNAPWSLDCSRFNTIKTTSYEGFNEGGESKVKAPSFTV